MPLSHSASYVWNEGGGKVDIKKALYNSIS